MIHVVLPEYLKTLARVEADVQLDIQGDITQRSVLDALEKKYPMLRGTIRDQESHQRRAYLRFFACEEDLSHLSPDDPLPEDVVSGKEPFFIIGAISGGSTNWIEKFDRIDLAIATWMYQHGRLFLRYSLAVIFIWFGLLKPLGMSPAADLVAKTVYWMPSEIFIPILGWWEVIIGVCLLFRPLIRLAILLLFLQMTGTVLPLFILPEVCFTNIPFGLTLEGQYIIKNLILISAGLVIGGSVRGRAAVDKTIKV